MKKILEDISKLYALVEEMNKIVTRLKVAKVEVHLGREGPSSYDPLGNESKAVLRIQLHPGCEKIER